MKKIILQFFLCVVLISLFSNMVLASAAESIGEKQETTRAYDEYCIEDNSYYAKNLINGKILEYDKNTSVDKLKNFFETKYEESEIIDEMLPKTLNKEDVLEEVGMEGIALLSAVESYGIERQQKPFSAVCLLAIKFENSAEYGIATGFVIGSNEIATVAHNLITENGGDVEHIIVYASMPGPDGEFYYRRYYTEWFEVPNYQGNVDTDYACISVYAEDIHYVHGYFDLNYSESGTSLVGTNAWIIGYRGDIYCYNTDDDVIENLFALNGANAFNKEILSITGSYVEIDPDSEIAQGYSGSPVFIVEEGNIYVIGIFSRRATNGNHRATLMSSSIFSYYNARINSSSLEYDHMIKNVSLNKNNFFSGQDITISVIEAPTQYSWVSLHKISTTSNFAQNATGMWAYLQTGNMNTPTSFSLKNFVTVSLSAHTKNVDNGTMYPLPQNNYTAEYKISLFYDDGYTEIAYEPVQICGSYAMPTSYSSTGMLMLEYVGTTSSTAWVGVYEVDSPYGHAYPSIVWTYVGVSDTATEISNTYISCSSDSIELNKWYCMRLYADNEYILLNEIEFIVYDDYTIAFRSS